MKTLFNTLNQILENPKYQASNGASYFIPGASQYLNPRSDDSYFETVHIEFNPTLTNDGSLDEEQADEVMYTLCEASQGVIKQVISEYMSEWGESDCKLQDLDNEVMVLTYRKAGLTLMANGSDMGFYITVVHCLC